MQLFGDFLMILLISQLIFIFLYISKKTGIFTKEYKDKTKYYELIAENVENIKLKCGEYDADEAINILKKSGFESNFHLK